MTNLNLKHLREIAERAELRMLSYQELLSVAKHAFKNRSSFISHPLMDTHKNDVPVVAAELMSNIQQHHYSEHLTPTLILQLLDEVERLRGALNQQCAEYCAWYDTGQPKGYDGAGMAYRLTNIARAALKETEGLTPDEMADKAEMKLERYNTQLGEVVVVGEKETGEK